VSQRDRQGSVRAGPSTRS